MFLLCVAGLPLSTIHAQKKEIIDDEAPNGIVIVTIDKAGDEIIRIMNESQLPYIHDPKAPRFLLMDKQGKFALGIGGYVRATGEYDFGGIVDDIDFVPANIPSSSKIKNQFQMDASTATIFLKLVGTPGYWVTSQSIQPEISEEETKHSSYGMLICHSEI